MYKVLSEDFTKTYENGNTLYFNRVLENGKLIGYTLFVISSDFKTLAFKTYKAQSKAWCKKALDKMINMYCW